MEKVLSIEIREVGFSCNIYKTSPFDHRKLPDFSVFQRSTMIPYVKHKGLVNALASCTDRKIDRVGSL